MKPHLYVILEVIFPLKEGANSSYAIQTATSSMPPSHSSSSLKTAILTTSYMAIARSNEITCTAFHRLKMLLCNSTIPSESKHSVLIKLL